jgi:hypothetical protein
MTYTVHALRKAAGDARSQAEEVLRAAAVEAERLRATANELDAIADQKMNGNGHDQVTCGGCQQPLVRDELGWRHVHDTACTYNAPAQDPTQTSELPTTVTP